MPQYEVIAGNIGSVYAGSSLSEATVKFLSYVESSKAGFGRVAHEDVTLLKDGEIISEHVGTISESLGDA